jgi:hypothetical protein
VIIEQALMTKLNTIAALTTITSTRIYFVKAPQDVAKPYVAVQKISGVRSHSHEGADGLVESRFQLSCFSTTYKQCKDMVEAIRGGLDGAKGFWGTVLVGHCFYDNETDLFDDDLALFGIAADYMILYTE